MAIRRTVIALALGMSLQAQAPPLVAEGAEGLMYTLTILADDYRSKDSGFSLDVRVGTEARAMAGLARGETQFAMMARSATPEELGTFTARWGYPPTRVAVAMDALVWVVNRDNPVQALRTQDIEAVFRAPAPGDRPWQAPTWGGAGLQAPAWADRTITPFTRPAGSSVAGLYAQCFPGGGPQPAAGVLPDASAMAEALARDPAGLCMANLVEIYAPIRAVPVLLPGAERPIPATAATVSSGAYPYARFLYVYVNKDPRKGLEPAVRAFLAYALSPRGQQLVTALGQAPLGRDINALNTLKVTDSFTAVPADIR